MNLNLPNNLKALKGWGVPLLALAGLVFALVTVLSRAPTPAREPAAPPPSNLGASNVAASSVAGIGVVEPASELIAVGTELPGIVRTVHVQVGQIVSSGTPLFTLDDRATAAQIATLSASLVVAQAQQAQAAAQYQLVRNVSSTRAVAQDEINQRKFALRTAAARVAEVNAQLNEARTTQTRQTVAAPIAGEVLALNVRPGEYAPAGPTATPLVRMGDTSTLHVRVEIDEENASRFVPGAPAQGFRRGNSTQALPLMFVRQEPFIQAKQNLAVSGQRVDTRVTQLIFAIGANAPARPLVGEQLDVFMPALTSTTPVSATAATPGQ